MGNQVMMEGNHTPGSRNPADEIPDSAWPTVLQRVLEKKASLRHVAHDSGVSQETIRRVDRAARCGYKACAGYLAYLFQYQEISCDARNPHVTYLRGCV